MFTPHLEEGGRDEFESAIRTTRRTFGRLKIEPESFAVAHGPEVRGACVDEVIPFA